MENIELTPEQQQDLDRHERSPHRVVDPRTDQAYVLVPEAEYEAMCELLDDDDRRDRAMHAVSLRSAANRLDEVP